MCALFELAAWETWERIRLSRTTTGLKIYETTITQSILFQFHLMRELHGFDVRIFEAKHCLSGALQA